MKEKGGPGKPAKGQLNNITSRGKGSTEDSSSSESDESSDSDSENKVRNNVTSDIGVYKVPYNFIYLAATSF